MGAAQCEEEDGRGEPSGTGAQLHVSPRLEAGETAVSREERAGQRREEA